MAYSMSGSEGQTPWWSLFPTSLLLPESRSPRLCSVILFASNPRFSFLLHHNISGISTLETVTSEPCSKKTQTLRERAKERGVSLRCIKQRVEDALPGKAVRECIFHGPWDDRGHSEMEVDPRLRTVLFLGETGADNGKQCLTTSPNRNN